MKIVKYKSDYKDRVSFVVLDTYKKFCAKDATKEAAKNYETICNSKKNKDFEKRLKKFEILYLAKENNKIVGMIGGSKNKISNLFVISDLHNRGIGKALLLKFEKVAKELGWEYIRIRSSLFGERFYLKAGYKKTTGRRIFHGNKIQPLRKYL